MKPEYETILAKMPTSSAWRRGVKEYARDLLEECEFNGTQPTRENLLNGAKDWRQFSEGGCALVYDSDIAERLCSPSELKRTRDGERQPNDCESWIDVQARALLQAARAITRSIGRE